MQASSIFRFAIAVSVLGTLLLPVFSQEEKPPLQKPLILPPKIVRATPAPAAPPKVQTAPAPSSAVLAPIATPAVDPEKGDLAAAIAQAKKESKKLFVKYGWSRCGNCRNLDSLIKSGQVKVPEDEFVIVNVHPREGESRKLFSEVYGIQSGVYPRVLIADSDNKVLAKRFGYGRAADYNTLLETSRKPAESAEATAAAPVAELAKPVLLPPITVKASNTTAETKPATRTNSADVKPLVEETPAVAEGKPAVDPEKGDLDAAIAQAKAEDKLVFVKYGWSRCGACRNLDSLLKNGSVQIPEDKFVLVNVHPVEGDSRRKFTEYYGIKQGVYPRIVIADTENQVFAKRFGYGNAATYNTLIAEGLAAALKPVSEPATTAPEVASSTKPAKPVLLPPKIVAPTILPPKIKKSAATPEPPVPPASPQPKHEINPDEIGDLKAAVEQAKAEGKYLFVKYGWEKCGACKNLDSLIARGVVDLPEEEFVIVNVHPITGEGRTLFTEYYGIKEGIYPRVLICDSENRVLAKRFGYGSGKHYADLLNEAYAVAKGETEAVESVE